jgi:short-subunit dehydrogenase
MASTQDFNGKWALVTGASAGIGAVLARDLCAMRMNIMGNH